MKIIQFIKTNYLSIIAIIMFLLGLNYYMKSSKEGLTNGQDQGQNDNCPNMLIEKDGAIYLLNSKMPIEDETNPIKFSNLEEYVEFVEMQSSKIQKCPILYLQYTTDTQNNDLIVVKPSILENNGGIQITPTSSSSSSIKYDDAYFEKNKILDATRDSTPNSSIPFNAGMYQGFDPDNQDIGLDTPLDQLFVEKSAVSANPMDPQWGGRNYTKNKLDAGEYADNYVYKQGYVKQVGSPTVGPLG